MLFHQIINFHYQKSLTPAPKVHCYNKLTQLQRMDAYTKKLLLSVLSGIIYVHVCKFVLGNAASLMLSNLQIHLAEADYLLGIRIHNYSNPTNQCPACSIEHGRRCCDTIWPNGTCAECNTYFYYCLQGLADPGECPDGRISYESTERGKTDLDFRGGLLLKLPNPYLYWGPTKSWIVSQ